MEENNNTQKEQKRAILVQKDALQKPLQHGLSITLSYEFIKTFKPEFAEMSDQELSKTLSGMSQEQLSDIFAGGVYVMTEETVERIPGIVPVGTEITQEPSEPGNAVKETPDEKDDGVGVALGGVPIGGTGNDTKDVPEEKPEEKPEEEKSPNRKKWLALLLVIPLAVMLKTCSGPTRSDELPPEPPGIEETTEVETEEVDPEIIDYLEEVPPIVIHNPTDATQNIKTLTDLGNQEHESNMRKEGTRSDGSEMWAKENSAVEGYEENKAHLEEMQSLMEIVNNPFANPKDRQEALLKMQEHALALYEKYDMEKIKELQAYTTEQLYTHEDSISETEEKIAADAVHNYEVDMGTQRSNVITLSYVQYLTDFGYDLTIMDAEIQDDGDLVIGGIRGERTIKESEKGTRVISFDEYKRTVEEALEKGETLADAIEVASGESRYDPNSSGPAPMKHGVEGHYDDPVVEGEVSEDGLKHGVAGHYDDPVMPDETIADGVRRYDEHMYGEGADGLKRGVEGHYDDPVLAEESAPGATTGAFGIGVGDKGLTISLKDLQELAAKRNMNPKKVEAAIKAMTDEMSKKGQGPDIEDGRDA